MISSSEIRRRPPLPYSFSAVVIWLAYAVQLSMRLHADAIDRPRSAQVMMVRYDAAFGSFPSVRIVTASRSHVLPGRWQELDPVPAVRRARPATLDGSLV